MSEYLGRDIRFRHDPLDIWQYGTVVQELPSPISGEIDRLCIACDLSTVRPGQVVVSHAVIIYLHLVQLEVLDPMLPDYDALGAQEPTSQYQDSRDAAGI